jgi:hypothetical protein
MANQLNFELDKYLDKKNAPVEEKDKGFKKVINKFPIAKEISYIRKKIKERIICDKEDSILKIKTGSYRYLKGDYLFPSSFWIYDNKVVLFIWQMPYYAILIKNKEVATTYRNYFEFFWKMASPLLTKIN